MSELNERQRRILARLVAEYIEQGEPVSSAWLAEHSALGLSSATVRNILARLEEQGLVHQPHTSAGRVPTDSGYRLYVDCAARVAEARRPLPEVEARLRRAGTVGDLLENASQELSRASHHVGFALAPASPRRRLRHIDFVPLEGHRVLVIVVATGGQITHKVDRDRGALRRRDAERGGQLHQRGVRGPDAARGPHGDRRADAAGAHALRRAGRARCGWRRTGSIRARRKRRCTCRARRFWSMSCSAARSSATLTLETLRALFRMIEEKHRLVELLTEYIDATGSRSSSGPSTAPRSASVQRRRVELSRRRPHRHGRRHRPDAHAISARDFGRRQRVRRRDARARRTVDLISEWSNRTNP